MTRSFPPGDPRAALRPDLHVVARFLVPRTRVLDVGCGDGALLHYLSEEHGVDARGIEISQHGVNRCVANGLSVIQGDADTDLADYPDNAFDFVILSQTLQATRRPRRVLEHMLRIGRHAVVSFPNFGHWRVRGQLFFRGRMPITDALSYQWHDTPNIHAFTIRDFVALVDMCEGRIERSMALDARGYPIQVKVPWWFWNLFGAQAVFLLTKDGHVTDNRARRSRTGAGAQASAPDSLDSKTD